MISIIVTTYNVGPFIAEALTSALALEGIDKEIIVVDDASSDDTVAIVEELSQAYPDVPFVIHRFEENTPGGVANAANYGLSVAKGDYVAFLDGDDRLFAHPFYRALDRLKNSQADFVMVNSNEYIHGRATYTNFPDYGAWVNFSPRKYRKKLLFYAIMKLIIGSLKIFKMRRFLPNKVSARLKRINVKTFRLLSLRKMLSPSLSAAKELSSVEAKKALLQMAPFPWRKIYRRSFIERHNLRLPEGDWMFEDNPFHWEVVVASDSFLVHDEITYAHRIWSGQTIASASSGALAIFDHAMTIYNDLVRYGAWDVYKKDFAIWLADHVFWAYKNIQISDKKSVLIRAEEVCNNTGLALPEVIKLVSFKNNVYRQFLSAYFSDEKKKTGL
ncbi:glycosyltransferase family 2 protein [Aliiroseovarius sp. KMU-50]|uniref:Glycosyltransferase family 2 protein n=1 Tax=Aliiroseovarius salicola TaxID=3009082 RepID=A0ABT4VX95_9RHOB|nr:glycosyltransferase family 2 protein [Aliiroseovarius sp. KMU-50]MDA5092857.1 glycosyltransferase family 2 protein [Aliiroseovarius sp. KMU-50]